MEMSDGNDSLVDTKVEHFATQQLKSDGFVSMGNFVLNLNAAPMNDCLLMSEYPTVYTLTNSAKM